MYIYFILVHTGFILFNTRFKTINKLLHGNLLIDGNLLDNCTNENLTLLYKKNKCADQTAYAQSDHRLCFQLLRNIISKLALCKISIFLLVSAAEHGRLNLTWWETSEVSFSVVAPQIMSATGSVQN